MQTKCHQPALAGLVATRPVHRSKRRLQPELGKIDAEQRAGGLTRERRKRGGALAWMGLALIGLGIMTADTAQAGEVVGWMEVNPTDGQVQITGRAWSAEAAKVDYTLQIQRIGRGGNTSTRQGGRADVDPGKVATLSTTSVNIQPQDELAVLLTISSGGQVIATSAIHVGKGAH